MSYEDAARDWDREVKREAERLVLRGVPPYTAIEQAVEIVSERRERAAGGTR